MRVLDDVKCVLFWCVGEYVYVFSQVCHEISPLLQPASGHGYLTVFGISSITCYCVIFNSLFSTWSGFVVIFFVNDIFGRMMVENN